VAGLIAPLAATRLAGVRVTRAQRRALLGAAAVLGLAVLAWASAPVTGLPRATGLARPGFLAESGLRYALPALLTAIVAVALAARSGGRAATAATAVLAAAVAWNVVELAQLGPPFTPSLLVILAGAAFGLAVLGAATVLGRALRPRTGGPRRVSGAVVGAALAAVAAGLLAIGATGYVERSSRLAESTSLGRGVVSWFVTRPNFAHGHRPIAFATRAPIAALAGDRFNHVLSVVAPFESCDKVRARALAGWVVVTDPAYGYGFLSVDPYSTPRCFAGRAPGYDDGTFRVYSTF